MPLQSTSGAASYDAFGGGVAAVPKYIEDYFSTFLFTGSSPSSQSINNGIDLSTKGGLVWVKDRAVANFHSLFDTNRGAGYYLSSSQTSAQALGATTLTSFNTNGFSLGGSTLTNDANPYVSWSWAKAPKFFDVVTYTGDGSAGFAVAHNLGSVPGCIIVKRTDATAPWQFYHRSLPTGTNGVFNLVLNTTAAQVDNGQFSSAADATNFYLGPYTNVNAAGGSYVAYIFAHNAGGFGLTGTDNVISCGSFTTDGSGNATVSLGYEPQWLLTKSTNLVDQWYLLDSMRGWPVTTAATKILAPNTSDAETTGTFGNPTATGFTIANGGAAKTYVYVAIRRGPMKVPTSGTKVFSPFTTAAATGTAVTTNFPVDFQLYKYRAGIDYWFDVDRLRGVNSTTTGNSTPWLDTTATTAEATATNVSRNWGNTGFEVPGIVGGASNVFYSFQRAPGFFDEVCYTGNRGAGTSPQTITHNLGVAPEFVIVKARTGAFDWWCTSSSLAAFNVGRLNNTGAFFTDSATPYIYDLTSTTFSVGARNQTNGTGTPYVAYLFATCAGVSKVTSFTGNGSSQTINCGFTAGSRFVMIKRTDSTGDWYVWDSARGIVSGNDPHLSLNSAAAEVTTDDTIDTDSTGFIVNQVSATNSNVNGASYIVLAIA